MTTRDLAAGPVPGAVSDTWGISGPDFLAAYIPLAALSLIAAGVLLHSRRHRLQRSPRSAGWQPIEVAVLGGGDRLAVTVALAELHRLGLVNAVGAPVGWTRPGAESIPSPAPCTPRSSVVRSPGSDA